MIKLRTLVLNADFTPMGMFPNLVLMPAEDAIVNVIKGACYVIVTYDKKVQCASLDMYWPSVIVVKNQCPNHGNMRLNKTNLFYRDGGICSYCGKELTMADVTQDHVIPRSKGGPTSWNNIVCSCTECNNKKGNEHSKKWKPNKQPYIPSFWDLFKKRKKFPIIVDDESWVEFLPDWEGGIIIKNMGTINEAK